MKTENYHCSITANTTAQKAFEGVSHLNEWWAKNFEGKAEKQNDVFTVRFGETFAAFTVTESVPGKKVVWHVTDCYLHWLKDKKEWKDTDVVFEILDKGNSIQINFTHVGLAPEIECYDTCVKGWDQFVKGSLVQLLNQGKGSPQ